MPAQNRRETNQYLLPFFWEAALGFWRKGAWPTAWILTVTIIVITLVNLLIQYRLNVWYRVMFDALDKRDANAVLFQSLIYLPLNVMIVGVAVAATYARMTTQRKWRQWVNAHLLDSWLSKGRYYQLNLISGDHKNPEYRL